MAGDVMFNLAGLNHLLKEIRTGVTQTGSPGPLHDMFKQWVGRYMDFSRQRFKTNSRGGGDWPPHAKSMRPGRGKKARRGYKGKTRTASILIDTGFLLGALTIGAPGSLLVWEPGGVTTGYGGSDKHPSGKGLTIAQIARWHQRGAGNLPVRRVIVDPDSSTLSFFELRARAALTKILSQASAMHKGK